MSSSFRPDTITVPILAAVAGVPAASLAAIAADPDLSWQSVKTSRVFAGGNPITDGSVWSANSDIATPPDGEIWLVSGLALWSDDADPLVAGGAPVATDLTVRDRSSGLISTTIAAWNNQVVGWPERGVGAATYSGLFGRGWLITGNALANKADPRRALFFQSSPVGGTITGTVHWAYQYLRIASGV